MCGLSPPDQGLQGAEHSLLLWTLLETKAPGAAEPDEEKMIASGCCRGPAASWGAQAKQIPFPW